SITSTRPTTSFRAGCERDLLSWHHLPLLWVVKLVVIEEWRGHGRRLRLLAGRRDTMRRYQHHQLGAGLAEVFAAEEVAKNRNVAYARHPRQVVRQPIVQQPGDHETLPILQLQFRGSAAGVE